MTTNTATVYYSNAEQNKISIMGTAQCSSKCLFDEMFISSKYTVRVQPTYQLANPILLPISACISICSIMWSLLAVGSRIYKGSQQNFSLEARHIRGNMNTEFSKSFSLEPTVVLV